MIARAILLVVLLSHGVTYAAPAVAQPSVGRIHRFRAAAAKFLTRAASSVAPRPIALPPAAPPELDGRSGYRISRTHEILSRSGPGKPDRRTTRTDESWTERRVRSAARVLPGTTGFDLSSLGATQAEIAAREGRTGVWRNLSAILADLGESTPTMRRSALPFVERIIAAAPSAAFTVHDTKPTLRSSDLVVYSSRDRDTQVITLSMWDGKERARIGEIKFDPKGRSMTVDAGGVELSETRLDTGPGSLVQRRTSVTKPIAATSRRQRTLDAAFAAPAVPVAATP